MGKTLVIQPVTRIEGHARITIQLDDTGNVSDTRVSIMELRGFERFYIGKPVEEMPRIPTRICGVYPRSHHLASAKATDVVFGVDPPPAAKKLRELCNSIAFMEEYMLHFYFLAGADFILGPEVVEYLTNPCNIPENICLLDVGTGIKKIIFTISLSEVRPEVIVIIDAVDKGRKPGEIFDISLAEIPKEKTDDFSIHQVPSSNLLKELQDLCSVKVRIMACQVKTIPETVQPGLSGPVKKAVRLMAKKIAEEYF